MIISHQYKFLFIEIDFTASWAIHHELCLYYNGQPILHKHATYPEFRSHATNEELGYYVFATVRNPLDKIVSRYFKMKNDPKGVFSNVDSVKPAEADYSDLKKYQYIKDSGADFDGYFRRFYKIPYSDMIDLSDKHLNHVIRFETLQKDFTELLRRLGIDQIRPLPQTNRTPERSQEFLTYYTPGIIDQAKGVCGPFMRKWNYHLPEGWGADRLSMAYNLEYQFLNRLRFLYFVHLRYNNAAYAVFLRKIRARLFS